MENKSINFFKGILCIGVIFIHIPFPGTFGLILKKIFSCAVPFFAMIAGYYAYKKDIKTIIRRTKKISFYLIFSYLLYFILNIVINIFKGNLYKWLFTSVLNVYAIAKMIFFCYVDFALPLWYLIAMLETYLIWIIVIKLKKEKSFLKFMPILFLVQIISVIYCESFSLSWYIKINFITRLLPWFLLGYHINYYSIQEKINIKKVHMFIGIIIGLIINILPTVINSKIDFSCIGYILTTPLLFCFCIKNNHSIMKSIEYIGKRLSLYIYIFHLIIFQVISFLLFNIMKIDENNSIVSLLIPCIVCIITILFCFIFEHIKQKYIEKRFN